MYEEYLQQLCFPPEFLGTALLMLVAWEAFLRKLWSEAQIPVGSFPGGGIFNPTGEVAQLQSQFARQFGQN